MYVEVEEGDLPSEQVDKLGVLRPLSLPPVGDGVGWALDMKGKGERVWEKTKGIGGAKRQRYGKHINKYQT